MQLHLVHLSLHSMIYMPGFGFTARNFYSSIPKLNTARWRLSRPLVLMHKYISMESPQIVTQYVAWAFDGHDLNDVYSYADNHFFHSRLFQLATKYLLLQTRCIGFPQRQKEVRANHETEC